MTSQNTLLPLDNIKPCCSMMCPPQWSISEEEQCLPSFVVCSDYVDFRVFLLYDLMNNVIFQNKTPFKVSDFLTTSIYFV